MKNYYLLGLPSGQSNEAFVLHLDPRTLEDVKQAYLWQLEIEENSDRLAIGIRVRNRGGSVVFKNIHTYEEYTVSQGIYTDAAWIEFLSKTV